MTGGALDISVVVGPNRLFRVRDGPFQTAFGKRHPLIEFHRNRMGTPQIGADMTFAGSRNFPGGSHIFHRYRNRPAPDSADSNRSIMAG